MNRKELHIQIDSLLEKLLANNATLKVHDGKFSQLETDLLRKQCIDLYDAINQLHLANMMDKSTKMAGELPRLEPVNKEPEPIIEKFIKEPEPVEIIPEPEPVIEKAAEKPEPPKEVRISEPEIAPEIKEDLKPSFNEEKTKPAFDPPKFVPIVEKPAPVIVPPKPQVIEEKSILDKINETKTTATLHETISSKNEENELSHRFANSKISKIKDVIDISKRFEMQSRLFGEDSNAYNISISELEMAGNKEAALELFNRFAIRYHWDAKNELALELKSFIYRKY